MRLIDADDIIVKLEAKRNNWDNKNAMHRAMRGAYVDSILIVRDAPTVECEPDKGWISVKDRMPKYEVEVLVLTDDQKCAIAKLRRWKEEYGYLDEWYLMFEPYDDDVWDEEQHGTITHWMPLSEPPKEVKDNE